MSVRILVGDVREKLAELPDESVHLICTSPPYWRQRDAAANAAIEVVERAEFGGRLL